MPDQPSSNGARGKIAAILLLACLIAGALWLARRLGDTGAVQDCASTGRRDCGS